MSLLSSDIGDYMTTFRLMEMSGEGKKWDYARRWDTALLDEDPINAHQIAAYRSSQYLDTDFVLEQWVGKDYSMGWLYTNGKTNTVGKATNVAIDDF